MRPTFGTEVNDRLSTILSTVGALKATQYESERIFVTKPQTLI